MLVRVNIRAVTLYAFSLVIMYLAGIYFGTFLFSLFIMFLILPVLSFAGFVVWMSSVKCSQSIDRTAPVKGDRIGYTVLIRNRGFLPVPEVRVGFLKISEALHADLKDFSVYLPPRGKHETDYRIVCPYRGVYEVGVSYIEITDQLGFITFRRRVETVPVTVYPRVLDIPRFAPVANDIEGSGRFSSAGILPDTTLFYQLKEYRDGDSIRHIYWKKYAATGVPFLKEYDRTKRAGVRIYFDCRPTGRQDVVRLEQEDVSVEALVAIVRYLLSHRVHTTVIAGSVPGFEFTGESLELFERFYRSTARLDFRKGVSPAKLFAGDAAAENLDSQTCIIISHMRDPELLASIQDGGAYDTIFVMNRTGVTERQRIEFDRYAEDLRRRGRHIVVLGSSSTIFQDLTGHSLAFAPGSGAIDSFEGMQAL